ncbi:MAG: LptF/LptG family permease [Alphaproteobacteria bacterium]|nr:LptF/LptG family permease [Alphaproteobacteria bacterium]
MKKLTKYISSQIFSGFLLVVFSLLAMLWLTQSLRFVEMVTNKGLPLRLFIELTTLLMPQLFVVLSPIAVFAAVLFVYNRLLSDRELVIMQASGISPMTNATGAVLVGILLSLFSIYVQNVGIIKAEGAFRRLEWEVKNNVSHLMFREGEFTNLKDNLTVFITKHESDGSVSGILLNDETNPKQKVTLSAQKGRIIYQDDHPHIILLNGSRQEIDTQTSRFSSLQFERYSVDLGGFGKGGLKAASVREKSISELLSATSNKDLSLSDQRKHIVEGHRRITTPWYNLVCALIACTGLLIGNFNRRGQTKIITLSVIFMVIIQGLDLIFTNLAGRRLYFLPFLYINCFAPLIICLYLLRFYNPFIWQRLKTRIRMAKNA